MGPTFGLSESACLGGPWPNVTQGWSSDCKGISGKEESLCRFISWGGCRGAGLRVSLMPEKKKLKHGRDGTRLSAGPLHSSISGRLCSSQ